MAANTSLRISDAQFQQSINRLGEFVKIPSVSHPTSPYYSPENLQAAADFATLQFRSIGFAAEQIVINNSAPFIIAECINKIVDAPTVIFYGHYDLQPVDESKWTSPPFVLTERDARLYARGGADDKGGIIAILDGLRTYLEAHGTLPLNVIVLMEGEEEYGSTNMKAFIQQQAARLNAHALIIMDGSNSTPDTGSVNTLARGVFNIKLEIDALKSPCHSGLGLLAPDAAMALATVVSSLYPPGDIPGFMKGHIPSSHEETTLLDEGSISVEDYSKDTQVSCSCSGTHLRGDPEQSVFFRITNEPNLSVLNFISGKPGGGNSIPPRAECEISVRTVFDQDPAEVQQAVIDHINAQKVPYGLPVTITPDSDPARAWKGDYTRYFATKYRESLGEIFPKGASLLPCGGTLPLLGEFEEAFKGQLEIAIVAVGDNLSQIHSHNESVGKNTLRHAIDAFMLFLDKAAADWHNRKELV